LIQGLRGSGTCSGGNGLAGVTTEKNNAFSNINQINRLMIHS
jgi:hypothetical protein